MSNQINANFIAQTQNLTITSNIKYAFILNIEGIDSFLVNSFKFKNKKLIVKFYDAITPSTRQQLEFALNNSSLLSFEIKYMDMFGTIVSEIKGECALKEYSFGGNYENKKNLNKLSIIKAKFDISNYKLEF